MSSLQESVDVFKKRSAQYDATTKVYYKILDNLRAMDRVGSPYTGLKIDRLDDRIIDLIVAGRVFRPSFVSDLVDGDLVGKLTLSIRPLGAEPRDSVAVVKLFFNGEGVVIEELPSGIKAVDLSIIDDGKCEDLFTRIFAANLNKSLTEIVDESAALQSGPSI